VGVKIEHDKPAEGKNPELTDREREVLQLILDGRTTREIAELLAISPHTATHHRANLMRKLEVHSQMELVRAAFRLRLAGLSKRPHKL
jgi:DNA-binding CsgD family transcriptional regulator